MANTTDNKFIVTGLFNDNTSAECAFNALTARGYDKDSIDVVMTDKTRDKYYSGANAEDTELGSKAAEGTGAGAAIGGTVGAVLAAIAAIGTSVVLPGLGLIVAGPLAAALVGGGVGGIAGGLIGALIGSGIPEEHAEIYETGVKSGGIVLRANPRNAEHAAEIESAWKECGGVNIYSNAAEMRTTTATAKPVVSERREANAGDVAIPVIEEELQVGKRTVEKGGVRVKTGISEREVEETVTLRDEKIHVDRRPVNRAASDADFDAVTEGEFVLTEQDEEAVVGKTARVVEEVVVGKDVIEQNKTISDTVRKTEVDVEDLSDKKV